MVHSPPGPRCLTKRAGDTIVPSESVGSDFGHKRGVSNVTGRDRVARLTTDRSPIPLLRRRRALCVKPELGVSARHPSPEPRQDLITASYVIHSAGSCPA